MLAAYASLLLILLLSALIGQALLSLSEGVRRGRPAPFSWVAPAVGIAALLVLAGAAARLPGRGVTAAAVVALGAVAALLWLPGRVSGLTEAARLALPVIVIVTLAASLPFLIAGRVGVLGAGLVNDDMASHLLIADYVRDPGGYVPTFVRGGYPIGPHAVVVALAEGLRGGIVEVFAGFTLALAPLTGLLGLGLLAELRPRRRIAAACLVALPYLGVSFLAMGAFKEPLQALILIAFAVLLASLIGIRTPVGGTIGLGGVRPIQRVLPLAVLAAASVFNYSLPGLLWIAAVAAFVLAARLPFVRPLPELPPDWRRRAAPYALGGLLVIAVATAQEWSRIADFTRLDALNPDRFGSDLGNLKQSISPLEALGIWPTGDYRTAAAAAGLPAPLFYLGGVLGALALLGGLHASLRRSQLALPAAVAAIVAIWALTALFSTPYIAAKALAIASPAVIAVALRGLLGGDRGRAATALAVAFLAAASFSSFLALRQAPVRPEAHSPALAEVRARLGGEEVLFLGRDDFIAWELRGSDQITGVVTNHYSVDEVRGRFRKGEGGGEKFDLDAVFPFTLDRFRYVLVPAGGPQSSPPARFVPVVENESYVLWERRGRVGRRTTLAEGIEPGAVLDCDTPRQRRIATGQGSAWIWTQPPLIADPGAWRPTSAPSDGTPTSVRLDLAPGDWLISLAYDSRSPLRVSSPEIGLDERVVANLDFRGPTPLFPVGEVAVERRTRATVTVEVAEPGAIGRLLRAPNEAHLRQLSATPLGVTKRIPRREACGEYVDWYRAR